MNNQQFAKYYDHQAAQQKWYQYWQEEGLFQANPESQRKHYSLLMPPPNLTGELHLGHAMQHSILDAIARFKRMQGYDVLLLPGVDHAGIQFEGTLNRLLAKEGLSKKSLGREEWLKRAWQYKEQVYRSFHSTWGVFGISADWSREVFSLDSKVQQAVFEQFKRFWDEGLLYKGTYIVQWCPKCGTAIEDIEMEYEEREEKLYFIRYPLENNQKQFIVAATVRPETIYADTAIAVYPDHPLYQQYVGQFVINPLTGNKIPVIEDQRVEKEFGTGALKITPGHDPLDYEIGRTHNLPILHAINKEGRMTEIAGEFADLPVEQVREQVIEKLDNLGFLEKVENYLHNVPICERCKTVVQPLISEEWFVKMKPLAQKAIPLLNQINFLPDDYREQLKSWMEGIHDWSISRSLWWGHRLPVWYCQTCNPKHEVGKDKDMAVSLTKPDFPCKNCGTHNWVQDDQVLDTWFSSGLWPLATLGWPNNTLEFQCYYPWDFEISAGEIKYLWIARMIMLGVYFTDQVPFKNMFFHGMLRDLQGRKFSKSLGNGIDPNQLRTDWGTDAARMALYSLSAPGRDAKISKQIMDERARNYRNFTTKLWNIARFIVDLNPYLSDEPHQSQPQIQTFQDSKNLFSHRHDKWIINQLNETIEGVTRNLDKFYLHLAAEQLYHFIWHKFADVYLEQSKERRREAQFCLEYVFLQSLKMLHPFMPFVTEEIYQKLPFKKHKSIMLENWPEEIKLNKR